MGCCNSNRPAAALPPAFALPSAPSHSDSVHLLLIKAYREKNAPLALSLLPPTPKVPNTSTTSLASTV